MVGSNGQDDASYVQALESSLPSNRTQIVSFLGAVVSFLFGVGVLWGMHTTTIETTRQQVEDLERSASEATSRVQSSTEKLRSDVEVLKQWRKALEAQLQSGSVEVRADTETIRSLIQRVGELERQVREIALPLEAEAEP